MFLATVFAFVTGQTVMGGNTKMNLNVQLVATDGSSVESGNFTMTGLSSDQTLWRQQITDGIRDNGNTRGHTVQKVIFYDMVPVTPSIV